jgi:hypothetical protein
MYRASPIVTAKRQRGAVDDGVGGEDGEGQRQRKRRKTEHTQTTLDNPTQYKLFRDSPLSRAPAIKGTPSQAVLTSMQLPGFTKCTPVRHMDFIASSGNRRDSVAQRIADETLPLGYDEDEDEGELRPVHSGGA